MTVVETSNINGRVIKEVSGTMQEVYGYFLNNDGVRIMRTFKEGATYTLILLFKV